MKIIEVILLTTQHSLPKGGNVLVEDVNKLLAVRNVVSIEWLHTSGSLMGAVLSVGEEEEEVFDEDKEEDED